jgi:hypothetical protein
MSTKHHILFFFFVVISAGVKAQSSIEGYAVNPKLGAYNWIGKNTGLAQGGEINILYNKYILSLDYYNCSIIMDIPTINQIDLLIGKYKGDKYFRFQFQGGLGTSWGVHKGDRIGSDIPARYMKEKFITIGIPIKLGFKLMPAAFLTIGIDFQANLNYKYPVYMTMASIEIGKIRNKLNMH